MARHPRNSTPKLTDGLIDTLADAIRHGAYVETAAALCGISRDTFYRWLRLAQDEDANDLLIKLSDTIKRSMAESEARNIAVVDKAAQEGIWQAAAWRLERKHPERWGRQSKIELQHTGPDGQPIEVIDTRESLKLVLSDSDAMLALETLEAKIGKPEDDKKS